MSQPEPSLNDDAVHDLDPSFITPPNKEGEDKPLVNITATQNDFPQPSEMGEGELYKAVNDSEVLIKTVIDEQESVHDLEDVTKTIMAQETISASQVLAVDKSLGGKLTEAVPLNRFTDTPTKTGLPQVKGFVANYLEERQREASGKNEQLIASLPEWSAQVQNKIHEYFAVARSAAESIRLQASGFVNESPSDRRYLVYLNESQDSLIDLRKAQLCQYTRTNVEGKAHLSAQFLALAEAVFQLINRAPIGACKLLRLSVDAPPPKETGALENGSDSLHHVSGVNLMALAGLLASPLLISYIDDHLALIQPVSPEDLPQDMAKKMRAQNTMVTTVVELTYFLTLVSKYFSAMHLYRESVSV